MKNNVSGLSARSFHSDAILVTLVTIIALVSTSPTFAATIGFSGNVVAPAHRALMPESNDIITFTNQVGIRFRSENAAAEPIKMKLSIRDSAGHKVEPVSITGSSVVQPKKQNAITLVLPMTHRNNEVFELCLQHVNRAKSVLNRTCSKLSVARLN